MTEYLLFISNICFAAAFFMTHKRLSNLENRVIDCYNLIQSSQTQLHLRILELEEEMIIITKTQILKLTKECKETPEIHLD